MSDPIFGMTWRQRLAAFALGAALWGSTLVLFAVVMARGGSDEACGLALAPAFLLLFYGIGGWDWMRQYAFGTVGYLIKLMVSFLIALTVVGLIPIVYWTGCRVLQQCGVLYSEYE